MVRHEFPGNIQDDGAIKIVQGDVVSANRGINSPLFFVETGMMREQATDTDSEGASAGEGLATAAPSPESAVPGSLQGFYTPKVRTRPASPSDDNRAMYQVPDALFNKGDTPKRWGRAAER